MNKLPDELQPIVVGQKRVFRGREVEVTAIVGDDSWPRKIRIRSEKNGSRSTSWLTTYKARLEFSQSKIVHNPVWRLNMDSDTVRLYQLGQELSAARGKRVHFDLRPTGAVLMYEDDAYQTGFPTVQSALTWFQPRKGGAE